METLENIDYIQQKRWFMGKDRGISFIKKIDTVEIGGTNLYILEVFFDNNTQDIYVVLDDEEHIGRFLEEAFAGKSLHNIFLGEQGYFTFKVLTPIERGAMRNAKNLAGEQSNSSFIVPGKFFFKLYRRIQAGTHPELEILKHLNDANFPNTPKICGTCSYKSDSGETYTLGILEELVSDSMDAWNYFNKEMDALKAQEMGIATAEFHNALKTLPGTGESGEEPPFDRLEELLDSTEINTPEMDKLKRKLPSLRKSFASMMESQKKMLENGKMPRELSPQRIHGDLHLGQILISSSPRAAESIKIIDFEGEPSRNMSFRRRLRSPVADIAGVIRSFDYAENTSKKDASKAKEAFLEAYAETSGIPLEVLVNAIKPYILAKAIYEACYELEFRPDWFWIPASYLLNLRA